MKNRNHAAVTALVTSALILSLTSSAQAQKQPQPAQPTPVVSNTKPDPALARAKGDMRVVLEQLQKLGAKPLHSLTVEQARAQPTPADAVKAVLAERKKTPPVVNVRKENLTYPSASGQQPARIYIPGGERPAGRLLPVIVYFHGGGWVIADIDTYDASAQALAQKADAIVVSADYRHAPEHKFPAAHEDAFAAYTWARENAKTWGGDPQRIAVAGESAGGNLAINVAVMARDKGVQPPLHMLLVYPVAGTDMTTASYRENADAMPLGLRDMEWFVDKILASPDQKNDPRLDLVGRANLGNLPAATVITAQIDPLRSEGRALADKLRKAGSNVTYRNYEGVTHEFFGMASVVADADRAQSLAVRHLRQAFNRSPVRVGKGASVAPSDRPR